MWCGFSGIFLSANRASCIIARASCIIARASCIIARASCIIAKVVKFRILHNYYLRSR